MISWFDWWIWIFPQPQALRIGSDGIAGAQLAQRGWTWWITLNHGEALRTWIYMDHQGSYVIMLPHPGCTSQGAATRMVGKTVFNPRSSRSHAVVMHGCSKAFKNFCLRWRSDLRSIKTSLGEVQTKDHKRPMFFFSRLILMDFLWFWPGKTLQPLRLHICWSQEASGVRQM